MTIEAPTPLDTPAEQSAEHSAEQPAAGRIIGYDFVDPHDLVLEDNVRTEKVEVADLDRAFVASIAEHGVLQPVTVRRRASDNRYVVRHGKTRTQAARQVGRWLDIVIERDPATETDDVREEQVERILRQLEESEQRRDLTDADVVRAHGQLSLDWGLSAEEIAAATHTPLERARRTTRVAASHTARDLLGQLDLGHLEVIAEFDSDDTAAAELVNTALTNPKQFAHVAQRLRQARALADARAAKVAELVDAGITVVEDPSDTDAPRALDQLRARPEDPAHSPAITAEQHAGCPGHAVEVKAFRHGVNATLEVEVIAWCLDPVTHGHVPVWVPSTSVTPDQATDNPDDLHPDAADVDVDAADVAPGVEDGVPASAGPFERPRSSAGAASRHPSNSTTRPVQGGHAAADPPGDHDAADEQAAAERATQRAAEREAEQERAAAERAAAERARQHAQAWERYRVDLSRNRVDAAHAAAAVRKDWLAGFLNRKQAPKDAVRYILEQLVRRPFDLDDAAAHGHDLACELLGIRGPAADGPDDGRDDGGVVSPDLFDAARSAGAGRATVLALAIVLAGQERELTPMAWRDHTPAVARYLRALQTWGYDEISPIEQLMIDPEATISIDGDPTPPPDPIDEPGEDQSHTQASVPQPAADDEPDHLDSHDPGAHDPDSDGEEPNTNQPESDHPDTDLV